MDVEKKREEERKFKREFKSKKIREVIVLNDPKEDIHLPIKSGEIIVRKGSFVFRFD